MKVLKNGSDVFQLFVHGNHLSASILPVGLGRGSYSCEEMSYQHNLP